MTDCRLSIRKDIADNIIQNNVTRTVITKVNDYTLGVNYSKDFEKSKTKDQAYTIARRLASKINTQFKSEKYGDLAIIDDSKLNIQIKIKPSEKLLDFYELRAFQKNDNLENKEAQQLKLGLEPSNNLLLSDIPEVKENPNLNKYIETFINKMNFDSTEVRQKIKENPKEIKEILSTIFNVIENKEDLTKLTSDKIETLIKLIKNNPLYDSIINDLPSKFKEEFDGENKDVFLTKLIEDIIINKINNYNEEQTRRINSWWNKLIKTIENKLREVKNDPYSLTAYKLITDNVIGKLNTDTILEKISKSNHPLSILAKQLNKYNDNIEIVIVDTDILDETNSPNKTGIKAVGFYTGSKIYVAKNANFKKGQSLESVLLHEIIHHLTSKILRGDSKEKKDFEKLFNHIKKYEEQFKDKYPLTNLDEFITGVFTNSQFISDLKNIQPLGLKYKSLWEEIIELFKNLFNIKQENINSLQEVLNLASVLIENQFNDDKLSNEDYLKGLDLAEEGGENITKQIKDKILKIHNESEIKEIEGKRKYVTKAGKIIKESVTEFRDRVNKKQPITSTDKSEALKNIGISGHADWENIITRIVEERNGKIITQKVINLPEDAYNLLEVYAINLINEYPEGTEFITESRLIDEKANKGEGRAGTPDFLAILPDGTVDILDYKFINFETKNGIVSKDEADWFKRRDYELQLSELQRILKDVYEVIKFGKVRIIPIHVEVTNWSKELYEKIPWTLSRIDIGDLSYNNDKTYLNMLPNMSERTGNESVDDIIEGLQTLFTQVENESVIGNQEKKELKNKRLTRIRLAIKQLQISQELDEFLKNANFELSILDDLSTLSDSDVINKLKTVEFYQQINLEPFLKNEDGEDLKNNEEFNNKLKTFSFKLNNYEVLLRKENKKRLTSLAEREKINDIDSPQKDIGWWQKTMRSFSQQSIPKLRLLYDLITKSKDKTLFEVKKLSEKIKIAGDGVNKFFADKGIKKEDYYNWLVKTNKHGNKRLIDIYSIETHDKIALLKQNIKDNKEPIKSKKELREFYDFNREAYEQAVIEEKEHWEELYKNDTDSEQKVLWRVEQYQNKYDINKNGLLQGKNRFLTLKKNNDLYSKEYNYIQENLPLKEFYDLFTGFLKESKQWLDVEVDNNFIPQIPISYIEQISDAGFISISKMKDVFLNSIEAKRDGTGLGQVNQLTKEEEYNIPIYHTQDLGELASTDMSKVLAVWANMVYNNKNMQEIEGSVKMIYEALKIEKQVKTDSSGKIVRKKDGSVETAIGKSNTLEAFIGYMNDGLYGISMQNKDSTFTKIRKVKNKEGILEDKEVTYSWQKIIGKTLSFFSTKVLAGNLPSALANSLGGTINGLIEGANGRFYTKREFIRGAFDVTQGLLDIKNKTLLRYFDIMGDMEVHNRANSLSVKAAERFFTFEKLYALQKESDSLIYNTILSAMLHSHTLNAKNKIVKRNKDEKSLYDMATIENDQLVIKGLTNLGESFEDTEEFRKFRRTVLELGKEILGIAPTYDVRLVNSIILGKIVMMFRNWIPRMADARFAEMTYNQNLETYEEGRYRAFGQFLFSKQFPAAVGEFLTLTGILSKDNLTFKSSFEDRMKQLYNKLPIEQQEKIEFQKFLEIKKQNLQATMFELQTILSFALLVLLVKPFGDDDDKDLPATRYMAKVTNRALSELTFFVNPSSTSQILMSPIPIMGLANDLGKIVYSFGGEIKGDVLGDEKLIKKYKPIRNTLKLFPLTSEVVKNLEIINKNTFE